jgi:hypothetical protein
MPSEKKRCPPGTRLVQSCRRIRIKSPAAAKSTPGRVNSSRIDELRDIKEFLAEPFEFLDPKTKDVRLNFVIRAMDAAPWFVGVAANHMRSRKYKSKFSDVHERYEAVVKDLEVDLTARTDARLAKFICGLTRIKRTVFTILMGSSHSESTTTPGQPQMRRR